MEETISRCSFDKASKIWFPNEVRSTRTVGGKVKSELTSSIEVVCLNCDIPDRLFQPASMEVPAGTNVMFSYETGRTAVWDGKNIADVNRVKSAAN